MKKLKEILTKKYGKIHLKTILFIATKLFLIIYIPITIICTISELRVSGDKYAAILISGHALTDYDFWAPPIAFLGSYPSWTFYFNSKNLKTDYILWATKDDLYRVLLDDKYQSVVVIGHGSFNSWRATQSIITNTEILEIKDKIQKKEGEWLHMTCPSTDFSDVHFGHLVMSKPENVFFYGGEEADTMDFVIDALTGFARIKKETKDQKLRAQTQISP